jgi:predicted restriction endonuclease
MCLYQVDSGKYTRYRPEIHGLWENGCRLKRPDDEPIESAQRDADAGGAFDADSPEDARERTDRSIVVRRGQQKFRDVLLEAYERRCAIAGFDAEEALEAAHIRPYKGQEWNHVRNGLLLRSDIHTLFDRHLIAVDTSEMTVLIADSLSSTMYGNLEGRPLRAPEDEEKYGPNREALDLHRAEADL